MPPVGYPKNTRPAYTPGTSRTNPLPSCHGVQVLIQTGTPNPRPWVPDSVRCKDLLHQKKLWQSVRKESEPTIREQQVFQAPIHKYVLGIINLWLAHDALCNDRSLTDTDRESSVTKLCPTSTTTQPLTPTNTQTISLSGHHLSFPPFIFSKVIIIQ